MSDSSATPWTAGCQDPLSMGFSRQEYWSGLHFLLQGIFLTQGLNPGLLHHRNILKHLSHQGRLDSQGLSPLGLTGLISLLSKELPRVFCSTTIQKLHSLALSLLYGPTIPLTTRTFVNKMMSLFLNMLSRLVITLSF